MNRHTTPHTVRPLLGATAVAALLVLAPLFDTIESALSPLTNGSTLDDLSAISAHEGRFVLSVAIGILGTLCYLPALLGLMSRTVDRAPWASRIGAALAVIGLPAFMAIRMGNVIELQGLRNGLSHPDVAALLDGLESNPIGMPLVAVFLLGTLLGMIAVAVAVWRAGLPRVAAVLIGLFPVADMGMEGAGRAGTVVAHAMALVGLGWVAVTLLRERSTTSEATGRWPREDRLASAVASRGPS